MPETGLAGLAELTQEELRARQLAGLRQTLRRVYANVPFYTGRLDKLGMVPDDVQDLADLARLPLTTKDELRSTYPFGLLAVPRERVRRVHASSGTSGAPTVVAYTERDLSTWAEVVARSIAAAGGRPGHLVHVAYGYGLFTGGLGAHYGAERLGCTVIPASGGRTSRQVQLINDLRPEVIMVTPTYMLTILDEFERQGLDPARSSLKVGIFGAEPWSEAMRAEIEARAGIDAVDIYGLSEVIGPGVAQESAETKDGLHVWEDHFYPEIVDPATGEPLPDGERGELVLTTLTKEGMPVIRYRTRDLTRLLPGTAHAPFRRMEKVTGRSDDMIILRGVNVFPTQIEDVVLRVPGLAPHFQLLLAREGRMDTMTVLVEADPGAPAARGREAAAEVVAAVKDAVGVTVAVEVTGPGSLARSEGKLSRVIDRREAPQM
ncbi:MAG: phenylacetate--CoA ligase [Nocardiopsaceae bacterium]|nr:phenylacetate--CoA ligase [Nocardiopsaceae bacterium]